MIEYKKFLPVTSGDGVLLVTDVFDAIQYAIDSIRAILENFGDFLYRRSFIFVCNTVYEKGRILRTKH